MAGQAINLRIQPQMSLAFGSIVANYTAIGTVTKPARIIYISNLTDALLQFSFRSPDDHFVLPSGGFLLLDVASDQTDPQGLFVSVGTVISVKRIGTPTTGSVYVTAMYGGEQ